MHYPCFVRRLRAFVCVFTALVSIGAATLTTDAAETERHYLSGLGPKDAVPWEFSVTGGRRAGETTTLPVPSQWELHGFGTYNYGQEPTAKANEHGLYRVRFTAPETWKGNRLRLVFDGVMTDATVTVNNHSAGPVHQGGFTRFRYDITSLVKLGAENTLEVDVAKVSANAATERAERAADYWVFGGIYRPVWIEVSPAQTIEHVAIDARADGSLTADLTFGSLRMPTQDGPSLMPERVDAQVIDAQGAPVGPVFGAKIPAGGMGRLRLTTRIEAPRLWTAETPVLYTVRISRHRGDQVVHTVTERFGFRTFEVRDGDGLYLNGRRILLKGINRHSFRPDTGRALTTEDCYADVRLIKELNMNAVRMSHYAPDKAFLEACDELGLYVITELSGWHNAHDTQNGRLLVRELVERDVNHPSILFWDNGNEGGWNRDLDGEFALYDPQQRRVLHPWETFGGLDTKHYPTYDEHLRRVAGPNLVMPTEFAHALYDGGGGAGLEDYWKAITDSPFGAGGFIWAFTDEGIVRSDQGGRVDVFSTYAPDGIVGPRGEKEGSFYTVRDLWSPVQITPPVLDAQFNGTVSLKNNYAFTSLAQCRFDWQLVRFPGPSDHTTTATVLTAGLAASPSIEPGAEGRLALDLPSTWTEADAVVLTAFSPTGASLWTWTWPTPGLAQRLAAAPKPASAAPKATRRNQGIELSVGKVSAHFHAATGRLHSVRRGDHTFALTNGPRLTYARPKGDDTWLTFASEDPATGTRQLASPESANTVRIELDFNRKLAWAGFKLEISPDGQTWKTLFDSSRRTSDGKDYEFPLQRVAAVRVSNLHGSDGQPIAIKSLRLGYAPTRFPAEPSPPATVTLGTARDPVTGAATAWVESRATGDNLNHVRWTLHGDGSLQLDYSYALDGEFAYHGITFDHPEEQLRTLRWLGEGPSRVWQNRLRGTWLGVHQITSNHLQPGDDFTYPESQGIFAGVRWAQLETEVGALTFRSAAASGAYLRVGTPRISHGNTSVGFPAGDLSVLHAIPPMGSKFIGPEKSGPASRWAQASGEYRGTVVFHFEARTPKSP